MPDHTCPTKTEASAPSANADVPWLNWKSSFIPIFLKRRPTEYISMPSGRNCCKGLAHVSTIFLVSDTQRSHYYPFFLPYLQGDFWGLLKHWYHYNIITISYLFQLLTELLQWTWVKNKKEGITSSHGSHSDHTPNANCRLPAKTPWKQKKMAKCIENSNIWQFYCQITGLWICSGN